MMRLLADLPESEKKEHNELINTAADCCVNQQGKIKSPLMIAGAPFYLHFPEDHKLKPDRMMEEYYYTLLNRERKKDDSKNKKGDKSNGGKSDDPQTGDKDSDQKHPKGGTGQPVQEDGDGDEKDGNGDGKNDNGGGRNPGKGKSPGRSKPNEGEGSPSRSNHQNQEIDNSDLGNHGRWNSESVIDPHATSRQIDTYTQRIIRESAKSFRRVKNRGSLPGYLQDLIEAALLPPKIPYYELIRQWVKGSKLGRYKRSPTHINRKRTYVFQIGERNIPIISPFPGRKRDETFKIGVLIDTSGSQTPDDILEGLSGCKNLIEKDRHCDTTVLEVDTVIHKEYKLKRLSDINFDVKGRGGTILLPGIERCRELNVDVCLCFTDGYTENFNEINRRLFPKRMIWVITAGGSSEKLDKTGYVVFLPERNE